MLSKDEGKYEPTDADGTCYQQLMLLCVVFQVGDEYALIIKHFVMDIEHQNLNISIPLLSIL